MEHFSPERRFGKKRLRKGRLAEGYSTVLAVCTQRPSFSTCRNPDLTNGISKQIAVLRKEVPEITAGFSQMAQGACSAGAIEEKTKELIAMGIAIALRCDACIGFHTKTLIKLGASRQKFEEMLAVTIYMGGGPSLMYAAQALDTWNKLTASNPRRKDILPLLNWRPF